MEAFGVIVKILAVLAVIAGILVAIIMFRKKIASFFRKIFSKPATNECKADNSDFVDTEVHEGEVIAGDQDFAE